MRKGEKPIGSLLPFIKTPEQQMEAIRIRFESYVLPAAGDDCWTWAGNRNQDGYGKFKVGEMSMMAHRAAWMLANGDIPDKLHVLHHCDNRACVKTEPDTQYHAGHLFLGTHLDNMRDMVAKGRKHAATNRRSAKITPAQVAAIQAEAEDGPLSVSRRVEIGSQLGIHPTNVWLIATGRTWRHDFEEDR